MGWLTRRAALWLKGFDRVRGVICINTFPQIAIDEVYVLCVAVDRSVGPSSVGVGKQVEDCRGLDLRFQFMRIDSHAIKGQRVQLVFIGKDGGGRAKNIENQLLAMEIGGLGSQSEPEPERRG